MFLPDGPSNKAMCSAAAQLLGKAVWSPRATTELVGTIVVGVCGKPSACRSYGVVKCGLGSGSLSYNAMQGVVCRHNVRATLGTLCNLLITCSGARLLLCCRLIVRVSRWVLVGVVL